MEEYITPLSDEVVCIQMLDFETSKSNSELPKSNSNIIVENYFFLENYITSEHDRGSPFFKCVILHVSTSLHCLLPSQFLYKANTYVE